MKCKNWYVIDYIAGLLIKSVFFYIVKSRHSLKKKNYSFRKPTQVRLYSSSTRTVIPRMPSWFRHDVSAWSSILDIDSYKPELVSFYLIEVWNCIMCIGNWSCINFSAVFSTNWWLNGARQCDNTLWWLQSALFKSL